MSYLNLSPWAREVLTADEYAGIEARAHVLGAFVSAVRVGTTGMFSVYVADRAVSAHQLGRGSLSALLNAVLDEFRTKRAEVEADVARYTPEEILVIAEQSGVVR